MVSVIAWYSAFLESRSANTTARRTAKPPHAALHCAAICAPSPASAPKSRCVNIPPRHRQSSTATCATAKDAPLDHASSARCSAARDPARHQPSPAVENGRWVIDTPAVLVTVASIIAMMNGPIWITQNFLTAWRYARLRSGRPRRSRGRTPRRAEDPHADEECANWHASNRQSNKHPGGAHYPSPPAGASNRASCTIQPARLQPHRARLRRGARPPYVGRDLKDATGRRVNSTVTQPH